MKRRQKQQPEPLRIATWGQDYRFGCPWCEFTDEGATALTVALHVHRDHPGHLQVWKLGGGRDWTVTNRVPV